MLSKLKSEARYRLRALTGEDIKKIAFYTCLILLIVPLIVGVFVSLIYDQGSNIFKMWWLAFSQKGIKPTIVCEIITSLIMTVMMLLRSDSKIRDAQGRTEAEIAIYGNAHFMSEKEIRDTYTISNCEDANRMIYGTLDSENKIVVSQRKKHPNEKTDNNNIFMLGAAGTGKTTRINIPMIMQYAKAGENMFITDPKGELYAYSAKYLERLGYDVYVFATKEDILSLGVGDCFNPLDFIDQNLTKAQMIAKYILQLGDGAEANDYFQNGELALFLALCMYFTNKSFSHEEGTATIPFLYTYVATTPEDTIATALKSLTRGMPGYEPAQTFINENPERQKDFRSGLVGKLNLYSSCKTLLSQTDFEPLDFFHNKACVFVIMDDHNTTFAPLVRCFFQLFCDNISYLADQYPGDPANGEDARKIYPAFNMVLEETNNIGKIDTLENILSTVRGRNMNTVLTFQNYDQILDTYEKKRESLISACHTHIFFGINDQASAEYVSSVLGSKTVDVEQNSRMVSTFKPVEIIPQEQQRIQSVQAPLLTPEQVRLETRDRMIIQTIGRSPMILYQLPYWKHCDYGEIEEESVLKRLPVRKRPKEYYEKFGIPYKSEEDRIKVKEKLKSMFKYEDLDQHYRDELGVEIVSKGGIYKELPDVPINPDVAPMENVGKSHKPKGVTPPNRNIPKPKNNPKPTDSTNAEQKPTPEPKTPDKESKGPPKRADNPNVSPTKKPPKCTSRPIISEPKQLGKNEGNKSDGDKKNNNDDEQKK